MSQVQLLDPREVRAAMKRSERLRNQAYYGLGRSLANGIRHAVRALARTFVSGTRRTNKGVTERLSTFAGTARVGWL